MSHYWQDLENYEKNHIVKEGQRKYIHGLFQVQCQEHEKEVLLIVLNVHL